MSTESESWSNYVERRDPGTAGFSTATALAACVCALFAAPEDGIGSFEAKQPGWRRGVERIPGVPADASASSSLVAHVLHYLPPPTRTAL
jgi:hypothetical protein